MILVVIAYAYTAFRKDSMGVTSEYAAFVVYFLGVIAMTGRYAFAVILTIVLMLLLSSKDYFKGLQTKITKLEFNNAIKFGVIAFVILPLLPDAKFSFSDLLASAGVNLAFDFRLWTMDFFNPYGIWFFVVAMTAIEFAAYILSKTLGDRGGIIVSGAVGGLVSSTAVTAAMTQKSNGDPKNISSYVVGTLVASCIMLIRVILIVAVFALALVKTIAVPVLLMFAVLAGFVAFHFYASKHEGKKSGKIVVEQELESPFRIIPAIKFAGLILLIKFISAIGVSYRDTFDPQILYYLLGAVSGLADVDAITQDMASKATDGSIVPLIATVTVLIAVISNNLVKASLAWRMGEPVYGKKVMTAFGASIAAGVVGILGMWLVG